jgi:hypothetical protein
MLPILAEATKELGYTEATPGSNRTKFAAEAAHANGQPWCATFVVAMARRVGVKLPSESAYTPTMANAFKPLQRLPQVGDLAFFNFPGDGKNRIQHVGIVESVDFLRAQVTCIEGNTSAGTTGSQDNGGGVYRRTRPFSHVVGFGRPSYPKEITMAIYRVNAPAVGFVVSPSGLGYNVLCADGGIFAFGDAPVLAQYGRVEYVLPAGDGWTPAA